MTLEDLVLHRIDVSEFYGLLLEQDFPSVMLKIIRLRGRVSAPDATYHNQQCSEKNAQNMNQLKIVSFASR